ncbi:C39 family peptidase [Legionella gresilensis]|uniref:C39 family peptidase n=1 Tax=Legionella gresilensis TaxID=91823 RepID=UPI0010411B88|nr:C39 family peptidase [Legionella gresilensis]
MIDLTIYTQPDDETCGPTSLHAIYSYYNLDLSLDQIISTVERAISGGTLASMLGKHALLQGFSAILYVNNLNVFDPTWFENNGMSCPELLARKIKTQMKYKRTKRFLQASHSYLDYMALGGEIRFKTLNIQLLKEYFNQQIPILTGLSATYLYRSAREIYNKAGQGLYDDIRGKPSGHFVVLCGYDESQKLIIVADPHRENPLSQDNYYKVNSNRLINAIMLGVLTYDANLLIIQPKEALDANYSRN